MHDSDRRHLRPAADPALPAGSVPSDLAAAGYRAAADAPDQKRWAPTSPPWRRATAWRRCAAASPRSPAPTAAPATASTPAIRRSARRCAASPAATARRSAALATAEVRKLVAACRGGLAGLRDRALLLLGYAAALRRSELAAVEAEHLRVTADGLELLLPRAKGDAAGEGARVGVPRGQHAATCPARAVEAWLRASAVRYGPVFCRVTRWGTVEQGRGLSGEGVRLVLLRRAAEAGVEGTHGEQERVVVRGSRR